MTGEAFAIIAAGLRRLIAVIGALCLALQPALAFALPTGGQVAAGQAEIVSGAGQTMITQTSHRAIIDWSSFDIGSGEGVQFAQPNAGAIALNRINSGSPSQILGNLSANGNVWLINPHGVMFGAGAVVNVGGLLASTANISNENFMAGNYVFDMAGMANAKIINEGQITVADAGMLAFVAPELRNSGYIYAKLGRVSFGAAETFTLDLYGDELIRLEASDAIAQHLLEHSGTIDAGGGIVVLTAAAGREVVDSLINVTGDINVDEYQGQQGRILIKADAGTALVAGNLSAQGSEGGDIDILGERIAILSSANINASGENGGGFIRIGGDYQGQGVTPTASRVIVQAGSNIFANALANGDGGRAIVWSDDHTDFGGNIEARGGSQGGDGGFVETSSHEILIATGTVDASSPWGVGGMWLLDPNNITIDTTANANVSSSGANPVVWDTTDDSAVVTVASILGSLNAGTSVTIQTGTAGANAQAGDITVAADIAKSAGGDATLLLKAANDIIINSNVDITSSSNKLNVTLNSDSDASGAGAIVMNSGSTIVTNGGNITLGGGGGAITGGTAGVNGTGFAVGTAANIAGVSISTVNAGGGNIIVNGQGGTAVGGNNTGIRAGTLQTAGAGTISLTGIGGASAGNSNFGIDINTLQSANGDIIMNGSSAANGGSTGSGGVRNQGTITVTGAGNIHITGTGANASGGGNIGVIATTYHDNYIQTNIGSITIIGQSLVGNSVAVQVDAQAGAGGAFITSASGAISLTGTGTGKNINFTNGGGVSSTGSSTITVSSNGGTIAAGSGTSFGGVSATGDITLIADALSWTTSTAQTTGNVSINAYTANTTIGVNGAAGTLGVTSAMLGAITAANTIVGRSDGTGLMRVAGADLSTGALGNLSFLNGSANIQFDGGGTALTLATNKNLSATTSVGGDITSSATGSIVTSGTGTVTLASDDDITFANDFDITTATGAVTLRADDDIVYNGNGDITTGGGAITLNSDRDASGAGAIALGSGTAFTTNGGNITLGGGADPTTGYARGTSANNAGITLTGATLTSGAGNILMGGTGWSDAGTNSLHGILLDSSSTVQSTSGNITLIGNGGAGNQFNHGISVFNGSTITSADGDILLTGLGGNGASVQNAGIRISGSSIRSTGTGASAGTITLNGTGNGNGDGGSGVAMSDTGFVTSVDGDIAVTGVGGNSWGYNIGITLNTNAYIDSAGTGADAASITLVGTGGGTAEGYGLHFDNNGRVLSNDGDITMTGTGAGAADIGIGTGSFGDGGTAGDIRFNANTITATTPTIQTTGNVYFTQRTAATTAGIAGAAGTLQLTSALLGATAAGNVIIGRNNGSGLMRVNGVDLSSENYHLSFLNGSANIQFDGGGTALTLAANKGLSTASTSGSFTTSATGSIVTSGTGAITLDDPVVLGGNLTLISADTITFGGTVNGGYDLTASAGTFSLASAFGGSTPLVAVSLTSTNALTLPSITASSILARTTGASSDLTIAGGTQFTASGSNTAITLASGRNFINSAGSGALSTPSGRWLVYSTNPASDTIGSLANDFRRFSCTYGGSCPSFPGAGNGLLYSSTPTLTTTPNGISLTYGDAAPNLSGYGYTLSGYLGSDSGADLITGSLTGSTVYTQGSNAGSYNVNYSSGSLASALGYGFSYANNATAITVGKKTLTAAVQNLSLAFGSTTPALSKSNPSHVAFTGLYGSDTGADLDTVTFSYGGAAAGAVNIAGSYSLGMSAFSDNNYSLALPGGVTGGTLSIYAPPGAAPAVSMRAALESELTPGVRDRAARGRGKAQLRFLDGLGGFTETWVCLTFEADCATNSF